MMTLKQLLLHFSPGESVAYLINHYGKQQPNEKSKTIPGCLCSQLSHGRPIRPLTNVKDEGETT